MHVVRRSWPSGPRQSLMAFETVRGGSGSSAPAATACLRGWSRASQDVHALGPRGSDPSIAGQCDDQDEATEEEDWWTSFEPENEVGVRGGKSFRI